MPRNMYSSGGGGSAYKAPKTVTAGLQAGQKGTKGKPGVQSTQSGKALADRKKQTAILGNV